jgi:hypothetical protein
VRVSRETIVPALVARPSPALERNPKRVMALLRDASQLTNRRSGCGR